MQRAKRVQLRFHFSRFHFSHFLIMDKRIKNIINRLSVFESRIKDDAERLAKLQAAWEIGRDAREYKKETGSSLKTIADECGIVEANLQRMMRFHQFYPKGYKESINGKPLMLSYYMAVMYVREARERDWYLKQAVLNGWTTPEIRRRVRNHFYESATDAAASGGGSKAAQVLCPREQQLYTYSAKVLKVVDADTLKVEVDVGFSMRYETKIRLRGINCAERGTKKGEEAKKFVEDELLGGTQDTKTQDTSNEPPVSCVVCPVSSGVLCHVSCVVIRSYKSEKYGRFLADVWYLKGETNSEVILKNGKLLNQVLLDKGFAQKVE